MIKIGIICLWPDNVDDFMKGCFRMLLSILGCKVTENLVVGNFRKCHFREIFQLALPLIKLILGSRRLVEEVRKIHISSFQERLLFCQVFLS